MRPQRHAVRAAAALWLLLAMLAPPAAAQALRVVDVAIAGRAVTGPEVAGSGRAATVRVTQGEEVELRWTTDEPAALHLHGYDVMVHAVPGEVAVLRFSARATGRYPVETHGIGADGDLALTLLYVEVHPR